MKTINSMGVTQQLLPIDHSTGNAAGDSQSHGGWFVGNFLPSGLGLRSTGDVEVKWGVHEPGDGQDEWTVNQTATTISILVRGKDRIIFPDGDVLLEHEGDYAIWAPGVPHKWRAVDQCVVISVRWPSAVDDSIVIPQDQVDVQRLSS